MISEIWNLKSKKLTSAFFADLSARGADDVGNIRSEFRRVHQPSETHEISQIAVIRSLQQGVTKLDLGCFRPLCIEIHLGTFDCIVHTSFNTWVTLFALTVIWKRVVFRFKVHDY